MNNTRISVTPVTERSVELPWLISRIGRQRRVLDIGSVDATYTGMLYELCRELYLCDTREFKPTVPATLFIGSASELPAAWSKTFDLVTCVSMLDHVGLDAYGNATDSNLIDDVLSAIERVLLPGGRLLLTVPFGRYQVTTHPGGGQRVFDEETLFGLFPESAWTVKATQVWRLKGDYYECCTMKEAADADYAQWRAGACVALELIRL